MHGSPLNLMPFRGFSEGKSPSRSLRLVPGGLCFTIQFPLWRCLSGPVQLLGTLREPALLMSRVLVLDRASLSSCAGPALGSGHLPLFLLHLTVYFPHGTSSINAHSIEWEEDKYENINQNVL